MPQVLIVIPARYASQRFPGKPLAMLAGKPLVRWTWEAAMRAHDLGEVVVATDDERIAEVVRGFGGKVAMTSPEARNGTERCAEVAANAGAELVVNLQGDSPLVRRSDIAALIDAWRESGAAMLTPFLSDPATSARLLDDAKAGRVGGTTVVTGRGGQALYFSKRVLPHGADRVKLHLGLYAYTPAALAAYRGWQAGPLESAEGLEQLRFLEHGMPIRMVEVPAAPHGFWEVNNPEDVAVVEAALKRLASAEKPG